MQFVFFLGFALSLLGMYVGIRRGIAPMMPLATGGTLGSIIFMTLFMLSRNTSAFQGILMGIVSGAIFAIVTLVIAWYFQSNERRDQYARQQNAPQPDDYYEEAGEVV